MIILAAAIVISLNNSGIISKANDAAKATNASQVRNLAEMLWAEAYLDGKRESKEIKEYVLAKLEKSGINEDDYIITVTDKGAYVYEKEETWATVYTGDTYTEGGGIILGENNLFDTTHKYRVTVESDEYTGQITSAFIDMGEGFLILAAIENGEVIYFSTLEEANRKMTEETEITFVIGETFVEDGTSICVFVFDGASCEYKITKIEKLVEYNTYIEEDCDIAYTCLNGVWDDTPIINGGFAEADIVAKFYKKDVILKNVGMFEQSAMVPDSNAYSVVISGTGVMGDLISEDGGKAWLKSFLEYMRANGENEEILPGPAPYITDVKVEEGIRNIAKYAFCYCLSLQEVLIPNSVTSIGDYSFWLCVKLSHITIPDSVVSIGEVAFNSCYKLSSVTLSQNITRIEIATFSECLSLKNIIIPEGVTSIGEEAFSETCLESVTIPKSVISIERDAFNTFDGLTDVYYEGTEEDWNKITIDGGNERLTNATIHFETN